MTINEAIERLEKFRDVDGWGLSPDILNSVNLGIEALEGIMALRRGRGKAISELLPGETEA